MTKYMKRFTRPIPFGRDQGHPETITRSYNDFDKLAKDFGKESEEEYYILTPLNKEELRPRVEESLAKLKELEAVEKKKAVQLQVDKLNEELKQLP